MIPFAEQLGLLPEYQVALHENRDVICRSQQLPERFILVADGEATSTSTIIKQYNYRKREWLEVHRLPQYRSSPALVLVNNRYLYIIGGCCERKVLRTVRSFDSSSTEIFANKNYIRFEIYQMQRVDMDSWDVVDLKPMQTEKSFIRALSFDNHMYVYGENKNDIILERYYHSK